MTVTDKDKMCWLGFDLFCQTPLPLVFSGLELGTGCFAVILHHVFCDYFSFFKLETNFGGHTVQCTSGLIADYHKGTLNEIHPP